MERCVVCSHIEAVLHHHHVIPQCFGGRDGQQVVLCATCHNLIHANALAILSFQRNGKPMQNFWSTDILEQNARPLIAQIVQAAQNYNGPKEYKMMSTLDADTYNYLKFIKNNLGLKSLEATLAYCIRFVYNSHHGEKKTRTGRHGW